VAGGPAAAPGSGDLTGRTVEPAPAPRPNLEPPRAAASALGSGSGSRGLLNLMPPPPERKSKLATEIEKAARPDCRTAHAEAGLLAVVPLVRDAVRDKGCRW
jgi:hypothetical protein